MRTITNKEVHVKFYDSNDIVPCSLQTISRSYFNLISPLDVPTAGHDNIMYKKNSREDIWLEQSLSIVIKYCVYDINDEFWDLI